MIDINELRSITGEMEAAIAKQDLKGFHHLAMDYQRKLLAISPNTMLRPVLSTLFDIIERDAVPVLTGSDRVTPGSMRARLEFFERMTNALESRNLEAAYTVMVESAVGWRPYLSPDASRQH
jgi:DNA-binding GntR family transcriptional regulator